MGLVGGWPWLAYGSSGPRNRFVTVCSNQKVCTEDGTLGKWMA